MLSRVRRSGAGQRPGLRRGRNAPVRRQETAAEAKNERGEVLLETCRLGFIRDHVHQQDWHTVKLFIILQAARGCDSENNNEPAPLIHEKPKVQHDDEHS